MQKGPDFSWVLNKREKNYSLAKEFFSDSISSSALNFHTQIPGYERTPLVSLPKLANHLGVGSIWVKNEALRLGLNSFKVLGGSFALYKFIQNRLGMDGKELSYEDLVSKEVRDKLGVLTFAAATDGNHGRGVAWAAQKLGHKCVIYVHHETSQRRIDAIASYGARVEVIVGTYDDAVRQVSLDAEKNGWEVISDTSWEGYTQVPTWIMQGYMTMMVEAQGQFREMGIAKPTHIFVQAGVGALAASVVGYYYSHFGKDAPKCVVVEPEKANCLYQSALKGDGKAHAVKGELDTIMAGLACGEPSELAWAILKDSVDVFLSLPDYTAARAMRVYAAPIAGDPQIISGESGAAPLGALLTLLGKGGSKEVCEYLGLNEESQILLINSEGDTDQILHRQIVWEGSNAVPSDYWLE